MSTEKYRLFAIKTTVGQEKNVARILENRARSENIDVASILILPNVRGYLFVEAKSRETVAILTQGVRHVKGRPVMAVSLDEVARHLVEKPLIDVISEGDMVEIIAGPLKGITGKVVRVDRPKKEVTVELTEAAFPLPISVPADQVRITASHRREAVA